MKLYDDKGLLLLDVDITREINRGGEGAIYEHPLHKDQVIKLYHTNGNLSPQVLQELMRLPDNFIKPLELFYEKNGKLKGLSMKYLDTKKLVLLSNIFSKASAQKQGFVTKTLQDIWGNMVISIMDAHKLGVVVGDLNPYNIFVSTKGEVYFIDVDSFQTPSRPHSGVQLPEIVDMVFPKITEQSDYFAACVIVFQLFTHVHPYKGTHRNIRSLAERMVKRISILSGDKDLIIPSFYEPFASSIVEKDFYSVFQADKRFLPNIGGAMRTVKRVVPTTLTYKEGDMNIRVIDPLVEHFDCSNSYFFTRKGREYTVYQTKSQGTYAKLGIVTTADNCYMGDTNVVIEHDGKLFNFGHNMELIHNFLVPYNSFSSNTRGKVIYFDESTDSYSLLNVDEIMNNTRINYHRSTIYVKSVEVRSGIIQTVMGSKWILDISSGTLSTLRTDWNIIDCELTPSGKFGVVEIRSTTGIEHYLFRVDGVKVTLGSKLNGMLSIAEKGDYLYIPANGAMEVYRKLDLVMVATIACRHIDEQSSLKACNAGILCLSNGTLYLLNKA